MRPWTLATGLGLSLSMAVLSSALATTGGDGRMWIVSPKGGKIIALALPRQDRP